MPNTLHVGIDVSHDRHDICLLSNDGELLGKPFAIVNNRSGAETLVHRLAELGADYDRILLGMEATGIYWYHLYHYLDAAASQLPAQKVQTVAFNPRVIHGFRKAYTAMDKTDPTDAFIIAERLRFGRLPGYPSSDARYLALQRLTRYRYHLIHTVVRTKCHALTQLFLLASEYSRLKPFTDLFGATSTAVLTDYKGLDELATVPLEELVEFIDVHGRRHFEDPEEPARILKQVAADSFQLHEEAVEPIHFALRSALQHIHFLSCQLKSLDRRIAKELERFPNTLQSMRGIGPVYASGLIAEIGDINRFPDDSALAKYAGIWWPKSQSGGFEAEERPISKEGNVYLRYYFCEAANSLRVHNEEYNRYYQRKYKESRKHAHKRAIVLTARKLVRLVDALLRKGQIYKGPDAVSPTKPKR